MYQILMSKSLILLSQVLSLNGKESCWSIPEETKKMNLMLITNLGVNKHMATVLPSLVSLGMKMVIVGI